MAIVDSQGRLFGKVSILDIGAALIILMVLVGIFVVPGDSGSSIAQVGRGKAYRSRCFGCGIQKQR